MSGDFREAIERAGLNPPERIEPSKFYRFPGTGKGNQNRAGWCMQFPDGAGGVYGDFASGLSETWQANRDRPMSALEHAEFARMVDEARRKAEAERKAKQAEAATSAQAIIEAADDATDDHPYLQRKCIKTNGLSVYRGNLELAGMPCEGALIATISDAKGNLNSLQFISASGEKRFLPGGTVRGGYHGIAKGKPPFKVLAIAEGVATSASIHEATGFPVVATFDAGNLPTVAIALREKYPDTQLIICADDDYRTEGNPGITKATEAALAVGGLLAVPDFGETRPDGATDFNDLANAKGAEAVKAAIASAHAPKASTATGGGNEWPELQPLAESYAVEPYPIDALPGDIGRAVTEVIAFAQAPVALAANPALAVLALAGQGLVNVRRHERLESPVSLYLMAIAESGERKSHCDNQFCGVLGEWEKSEIEKRKEGVAHQIAEVRAWKAECEGIEAAIKTASAKGEIAKIRKYRDELKAAQAAEPPGPKIPQLLYEDTTTENLAQKLGTQWPSGAILSSEAGIVFGGYAMQGEKIMANLSNLNKLWEGGSVRVGRKTSQSFTTEGARLSMGLATQADTVRALFTGSKGLARGSGFAARFLWAWPESTQGTRLFKVPIATSPGLNSYRRRILELLDAMVVPQTGPLELSTLTLSPPAFEVWQSFHDDVERELRADGEMSALRDVASKVADNAARLAGLFHVYQVGHQTGQISADHMAAGCKLAGWHLYEARRFLGDMATPQHMSNALKLEAWLIGECHDRHSNRVDRSRALQHGPNPIRSAKALDEALRELQAAGHIMQTTEGRKAVILVRPELIGAA